MTLLATFLQITADWRDVFPQARTTRRAIRQALGSLICLGRRCLSRIIWANGHQDRSWSAEYFLHSRCQWDPQALFHPILERALPFCRGRLVGVAVDDTRLRKTGLCIRPSCLDLITLLRKEMVEHPELLRDFDVTLTDRALTRAAAA